MQRASPFRCPTRPSPTAKHHREAQQNCTHRLGKQADSRGVEPFRIIEAVTTTATCWIEGCDRPAKTRGWCELHYGRWYKYGDTGPATSTRTPLRDGPCAVEGCDRDVHRREWCNMHYQRWYRHGDPTETHHNVLCSIDGCDRPAKSRGWCQLHYDRWRKHGDTGPVTSTRTPLSDGPCAVEGCDRSVERREWCMTHYQRWLRHGDPATLRRDRERPPCSVEGCESPARGRGYCPVHAQAARARGRFGGDPCSIEGCDSIATSRGWCPAHYKRWWRHGDPEAPDRRKRGRSIRET